jgi:hemerythrin superfamily protein
VTGNRHGTTGEFEVKAGSMGMTNKAVIPFAGKTRFNMSDNYDYKGIKIIDDHKIIDTLSNLQAWSVMRN